MTSAVAAVADPSVACALALPAEDVASSVAAPARAREVGWAQRAANVLFGAPVRGACGGAETSFTPKVLRNGSGGVGARRARCSPWIAREAPARAVCPHLGERAGARRERRTFVASYPCGADRGGWRALELAEVYFSEALGLPGEEHRRRRVDCYRAAEMLLLHAAARGNIGAHCRLGVIYEGDLCEGAYWDGLADRQALHKADTPCDERAYLHFSFGAYHGHGECCWRLGDLVAAGRGCASSAARAFSLYRRAFDLESGRIDEDRASTGNAALRLARAFELGRGCERTSAGAHLVPAGRHWPRRRLRRRSVALQARAHRGSPRGGPHGPGDRGHLLRATRPQTARAARWRLSKMAARLTGWHSTLVFWGGRSGARGRRCCGAYWPSGWAKASAAGRRAPRTRRCCVA
ncbi:MAG: hypothetical protein ACLUW6_03930 [Coriobacteriaceae bacterium]